jgi:hypothetical protein
MVDQSKIGTDWSADELDAIVADYFAMLEAQDAGQPFVKAQRARALDQKIGRGHKSIEFKHMNISAVLAELGMPVIRGYRPMSNYQRAIFPAVDRYLDAHPDAWAVGEVADLSNTVSSSTARPATQGKTHQGDQPGMADEPALWSPLIVEDAPSPGAPRKPRPEGLERLVRKFDPAARDHRLGLLGEERIFHHERARLNAADRADLARKVEWTSQERGDGAGYDIKSFHPNGIERLIEVKATRGGRTTPFFLTRTEREVSQERPAEWRLFRLYELSADPKLFRLKPPLESAVTLEAETWRASVG